MPRPRKVIEPKICEKCGVGFVPKYRKYTQRFCSRTCAGKPIVPVKKFKAELGKRYRICPICNKEYFAKFYRQIFCKLECANAAKRNDKCTKCGGDLCKCYGGLKLCNVCHDEYKFKNYLRRLRNKFSKAYGDEKIELGLEIRKAEAVSDVGLAKIKGDQKWLKNHPNEIKLATENTKLTAFQI